ncbi:MAG: RNA polymerase sigma factor [Candidatus Hydrogenedentota bacterium]
MNMHGGSPTSLDEAGLIKRVCSGDVNAFELLCTRLEGPLYGYAYGMVRNSHEAEDIVQESLFRLYQAMRARKLRPGGSTRSFLFAIAHNLAADNRRRARPSVPLEDSFLAQHNGATESSLLREQLNRALADLPANHRSALMLREFGDLRYAEIAETLGASLDEVKVWIHRGRKRLATLLDRDGQYLGKNVHEL